MQELKRIGIFTQVVETGSFSAAARRIGVAKSAISKQIAALEMEIGARLFNRSTRKLLLTEAGQIYYRHCSDIVDRADLALNEVRQYQDQPQGTLRISSPVPFAAPLMMPVIRELRMLYPLLKIDLKLDDRVVDMLDDGIDLAIRAGVLQDSALIAKKLCDVPVVAFASPEYLAQHGTPQTPSDLVDHQWLTFSVLSAPLVRSFRHKSSGQLEKPDVTGSLAVNSVDGIIAAAKQGLGISALASVTIHEELQSGVLVPLLPNYVLEPMAIYAVYPHREHLPPKTRIFMDILERKCAKADWVI